MKKSPWILAAATVCVIAVGGGGTAFAMSNEAQISVYGEESSVRTFSQPTVGDLLAAEGIEVKDTDLVTPALDEPVTDGMDIQVVQRTPVTVTIDGVETDLLTTGDTVADALAETEYKAEAHGSPPSPRRPSRPPTARSRSSPARPSPSRASTARTPSRSPPSPWARR